MKLPLLLLARALPLTALLCLGGCASFDPQWRAADGVVKSRWDGRWTSEKHHTPSGGAEGGRLRCVLERLPDGKVDAHFHANFLCFSGNYSVVLQPKPGSKTDFSGTSQLPQVFGGTYQYSAHIVKDKFTAAYDSVYDKGTFDLTRVKN